LVIRCAGAVPASMACPTGRCAGPRTSSKNGAALVTVIEPVLVVAGARILDDHVLERGADWYVDPAKHRRRRRGR
jgi:hypothetical protein